jgi:hypothetical protein
LVGSPDGGVQAHTGGLGLFFFKKKYIYIEGGHFDEEEEEVAVLAVTALAVAAWLQNRRRRRAARKRYRPPYEYAFSSFSLELMPPGRAWFWLWFTPEQIRQLVPLLGLNDVALSPSLYRRCVAVALHPCCPPFLPW